MKKNVPFKALSLLLFILAISFTTVKAQLQAGSIDATSSCTNLSTPAGDILNVTPASGGVAPYTYEWEAKIPLSGWAPVILYGNGLNYSPGQLLQNTSFRRKVTDAHGDFAYSNSVNIFLTDYFAAGDIWFDNMLRHYNSFLPGSTLPTIMSVNAEYGTGSYGYQWQSSSSAFGPWSDIAGETGLSYQPAPINTLGSYFFRIKATDLNCGTIAYSAYMEVKIVNVLPFYEGYFATQYSCVFPNNTPSVLQGSVPMGGTPPYTYEWEQKPASSNVWQPIANSNTKNYQPDLLDEDTWFRRKTTDANGNTGYSNEDIITLVTTIPIPGVIASNETAIAPNAPYDAAINIKSAYNFFNGQYAWQKSLDDGNTWSNIPGYTYSTYYPPTTPTTVKTCYRRSIREFCATDSRDTWTNTVCVLPALPLTDGTISINGGSTACNIPGSTPVMINGTPATGGSTPYTYKWQSYDGTNWIDIANSNTVSYTPPVLNYSVKYRRIVTDANNTSLTSNEVIVSIQSNSPLRGGLIDGPIVTCSNTAPGIINNIIDACGGGGVFTYSWEANTNGGGWTTISGADQPTYNATSISETTKFRRKIGDGCGNATYSNEVEVFVYPAIEGGTLTPATQTVCNTTTPESLGLTQNCHYTNGNVTYQWQTSASPSGPWTNIFGATQAVYQPKASNNSSYYRLEVKSSVCNAVATSTIATINVNSCSKVNPSVNILETNLSVKGDMKLYPNPVMKGQTINITLNGGINPNYRVQLRSIDGRVYNSTLESSSNKGLSIKLPNNLTQGTYLIQVSNGKQQWVDRIVVL